MKQFPIPPEYCLIVNAFSQASTLRGAAQLLGTDPAALVRKVQKLSSEFDYLQKVGNRWAVTESGRRLAQWTDEIINSQTRLMDEKPRLRIAAFTWLTEEMLIPEFHKLSEIFGQEYTWSFKLTSSDLEQELIQSRSDFVITGHPPNDPAVAHKKVSTYPWTVIVPYLWKKQVSNIHPDKVIEFLNSRPFIRHEQMSPEKILNFKPSLTANILVNGVIGLRSAVTNELGWSVVPAMSVRSLVEEKKVFKLSVPTNIKDNVSIWWLRARKDTTDGAKALSKWVSQFEV